MFKHVLTSISLPLLALVVSMTLDLEPTLAYLG
jgi:hypothetical protein